MTDQGYDRPLGWLGTGRMGAGLVLRMLARGCDVSVYNRTRAKAEVLAARGAKVVDSAADLAGADIVFVTVGSSQDLIDAVLGPDGLLHGCAAPAIVVDCSTVSFKASQQVRQRLEAPGGCVVPAPQTGDRRGGGGGRARRSAPA